MLVIVIKIIGNKDYYMLESVMLKGIKRNF